MSFNFKALARTVGTPAPPTPDELGVLQASAEDDAAFMTRFRHLLIDQCGATAVEYTLIISALSLVVAVGIKLLGSSLNNEFGSIASFFASN